MNILKSLTYFSFFYNNIQVAFNSQNEQSTLNSSINSISKRTFSLLKLIPATFGLFIGSVLWIKEHSLDKMMTVNRTQDIARENNIGASTTNENESVSLLNSEAQKIVTIDENAPINQTFMTFPLPNENESVSLLNSEAQKIVTIDENTPINQTFITFPFLEISRLGDYAKFYLNAKWIARQLDVPVIIRSFPNSSKLKISENHKYYLQDSLKTNNFTPLTKEQVEKICRGELKKEDLGHGIFTVPYFWEWKPQINWAENKEFKIEYNNDFMPASNVNIPIVEPVEGKVNIAIQVRDGGSFDNIQEKFLYPLRFPDLSYYEAQLEYVLNLPEYKNQPVNIHIFTDAVDPSNLKTLFESVASRCGRSQEVTINYRSNNCSADDAILSDLMSASKFPIFIRANSGFSDLAAFFGQPELEIYPHTGKLTEEKFSYVDQVKITQRGVENSSNEVVTVVNSMYKRFWPEESPVDFNEVYCCYTRFCV